jgi:hypothetical protein
MRILDESRDPQCGAVISQFVDCVTLDRWQRIDRCDDLFDWTRVGVDLLQSCSGSSTPPGRHRGGIFEPHEIGANWNQGRGCTDRTQRLCSPLGGKATAGMSG